MPVLLFDFGGTLDSDGRTWFDRFFTLYKEEGVEIQRETFARAFYAADDHLAERHKLDGLSMEATVALQAADVCSEIAPRRHGLAARVAERFVEESRRDLRKNRAVLERLSRRHKLGVVSNFYGNLDSVLASEGLRSLFGVVADSAVVGTTKPEPGIFRHALNAFGAQPSEATMIGDSIPRDMRGAEGLGLRHALITGQPGRCCDSALAAKSLSELEPLLG
jgi:HAD superfamily hydrolase (TIGR01509 family)